ncbi:hypothetical protein LSAT2_003585 [Lamellibrachia satsuma]|nr:hypothetical protein LSAT2_003585 [Lamellibrachia satsuma]
MPFITDFATEKFYKWSLDVTAIDFAACACRKSALNARQSVTVWPRTQVAGVHGVCCLSRVLCFEYKEDLEVDVDCFHQRVHLIDYLLIEEEELLGRQDSVTKSEDLSTHCDGCDDSIQHSRRCWLFVVGLFTSSRTDQLVVRLELRERQAQWDVRVYVERQERQAQWDVRVYVERQERQAQWDDRVYVERQERQAQWDDRVYVERQERQAQWDDRVYVERQERQAQWDVRVYVERQERQAQWDVRVYVERQERQAQWDVRVYVERQERQAQWNVRVYVERQERQAQWDDRVYVERQEQRDQRALLGGRQVL